ncbi:hypothetical protein N7471_002469 [Penicillium samsonianum]|uniref:uncharacterized protein n=1 Tax=Penicillium samsonianum TaxID=1882272 RepID=UPI002546A48D|nr:uncharacterized protein N7471_002469 [Penicillium samsonianum]KAJ6143016.1 hypothetical protein N7471_002469 [Penicillium samsonianum]
MRYSFTITALSLLSSAFSITVTTPSSNTVWDFSTAKTIKFTSDSSDPSVISIILRSQDGSFQTKLADNVKTSDGEYTTQPNPSISNGVDYEIQIIDSAGQLAVSDLFTVKKGASDDGTTSSSSSTSSSTTTTTSSSSTTSSSATFSATTSTSVTSTLTSSASSTPTPSTSPLSSSGMMQLRTMLQGDYTNTPLFITGSTTSSSSSTSSSKTTSSTSSDNSSTSASASPLPSTGAASSQLSAPKGAMALLGAAFALFYI